MLVACDLTLRAFNEYCCETKCVRIWLVQPWISIVTPVHISNNTDLVYLRYLINSCLRQNFHSKELIISDDLNDKRVKRLCEELDSKKLRIRYTVAPVQGISNNLNHAIMTSRGKLIKILFQDDFLTSRFALLFLSLRLFFTLKKWHVSGSIHFEQSTRTFFNRFKPRISNNLLDGKNYISSPSVVTFKCKSKLPFDPSLIFLLDCEWYLRMSHNFGLPVFGRITLVANRIHQGQATHWAKQKLKIESTLAKDAHDNFHMRKAECKCARRFSLSSD